MKFLWNTAADNLRVLNFMRNPYWRIFLLISKEVFAKLEFDKF